MRLRRIFTSLCLAVLFASPSLCLQPLAQTLAVNWFTPRYTLTMADQSRRHLSTTGRLRLPDRRGATLAELGHIPRTAVSSEDGLFYAHNGFDHGAICTALDANRQGRPLRGASTISQQTARNLFLYQGRTWLRKGLEVGYTVLLETFVRKDRILELYLNIAETGPMVFGMQAAAHHWYGRDAAALDLDQAARITALLPLPRRRNPKSENVRKRARWIRLNLAPMPGERGMQVVYDRAEAAPWAPWCIVR